VTVAIVAVLVSMGFREANRIELMQGIAVWVVLTIVYFVKKKTRASTQVAPAAHDSGPDASGVATESISS